MFLRIHIPPIYVPIYVPVCACVCRGSTCVYVCACEYCRRKIYFPSDNTIHTCNDHWLENIFSFRQYTHAMIIDWKIYIFFFRQYTHAKWSLIGKYIFLQTIHTWKYIFLCLSHCPIGPSLLWDGYD